jgi:hypothetical protein
MIVRTRCLRFRGGKDLSGFHRIPTIFGDVSLSLPQRFTKRYSTDRIQPAW